MASQASAEITGFRIAPVQEQLWSEQNGSDLFVTECRLHYSGGSGVELNVERLRQALGRIISRYEILRTRYHVGDGRRFPVQVILDDAASLLRDAVSEESEEVPSDDTDSLPTRKIEFLTGEHPISLQLRLIRINENEAQLLLSIPTMSGDSRTLLLLVEELIEELRGNQGDIVEDEILQYAQYAEWSRQFTEEPDEEGVQVWRFALENRSESLDLFYRRDADLKGVRMVEVPLGADLSALAELLSISLEDLMIALWGNFLLRLGRGNSLEVRYDHHGRDFEELAGVIGLVARTIPLNLHGSSDASVAELLKRTSASLSELREASDYYPFDENEEGERGGVGVEVIELPEENGSGFRVESLRSVKSRFLLKLSALLRGDQLAGAELLYDASAIDPDSAAIISRMFARFVRDVVADPERPVGSCGLLDGAELEELHAIWNGLDQGEENANREDVLSLIERNGEHAPDAIAVLDEGARFTYADLLNRAADIAAALRERGIGRGEVVPICLERSFDAVAAIVGVLKSGAAFLPIDPKLPEGRRAFMVQDSGGKVVITSQEWDKGFEETGATLLLLSQIISAADVPAIAESVPSTPDDPAYVIYTSGSTGTPKGCVIRRRNIASYVGWGLDYYFAQTDAVGHWPLFTSLSFDLTLTSIFCALAQGGSITIFGEAKEMPEILREIFSPETDINIVKMTPAQGSILGVTGVKRTNVRAAILGGEQLGRVQVEALLRLNPEMLIFNEYGPTETTIGCIVKSVGGEDERIIIGSPIAGARAYIADENGELLAPYRIGELWIAGAGVGAGYLNREELTAERFRNDLPFCNGTTAYKTGDLARRYPDGKLEYLGRNDDQVKVRGYRIEPGEIREGLRKIEGVRDAVVLPRTEANGENVLVAWYVPEGNVEENRIREGLGAVLPDYMIPQFFVPLESIPLTINGKPDVAALPDPHERESEADYIPPRTETERVVAEIWETVLGVDRVGACDDFFRLGGHSLRAMRAIAQLNMKLGIDLKVQTIFEHPTVEGMGNLVDGAVRGVTERIEPVEPGEYYELSDAQRRLWVLEQMEDLGDAYHIAGIFDIEGAFDPEALRKAFDHIIERHEILRTTFQVVEGRPMQRVEGAGFTGMEFVDLEGGAAPDAVAEKHIRRVVTEPFDMGRGPLIRILLLKNSDMRYRLAVALHHIISDGWSVGILIRELVALYRAHTENMSAELSPLRIQYKDFAAYQQKGLAEGRLAESRGYWLEKLAGARPLDLPLDMPRPQMKSYRGGTMEFSLDRESVAKIETLTAETGSSLFMVLTALFNVLLYRYTGQDDITIGTAIAGRDHADLDDQLGFYVNVLPLRTTVRPEETFRDLLARVRETATEAYTHQSYPFDRLIDELGVERETGRSPLFDLFLVLQNNEQESLRFGDALLTSRPLPETPNKYDLSFDFAEEENGLRCEVNYNSDVFLPERIENLIRHLKNLADAVLSESGEKNSISTLPLLSEEEMREIVGESREPKHFTRELERTLPELVDEIALQNPERSAITFDGAGINYDELRRRSNGIARLLRERMGAREEGRRDCVALLLPRSGMIPLLFLSILKAGGTYVPIDPDYPEERIRTIVRDSGARLLVTDERGKGISFPGLPILSIEEVEGAEGEADRPYGDGRPEDIAAILYTSGSTGEPKGVLMEHRGLINTGMGIIISPKVNSPGLNVLQFASLSFDASLCEMLFALLHGSALVVVPRSVIDDPSAFVRFVGEHDVNFAILPPAYLATLNRTPLPSFRAIVTAGESPIVEDAAYYSRRMIYVNGYGPTECSICVSDHYVDPEREYGQGIPLGVELPNIHIVILDDHGNLLPAGMDGEICVLGVGVGPGYLNPEQTAAAFIEHPLFPGERMYRTGDLGRRNFNGEMFFRGRRDNQVKVRGHRVEPEEIATTLQKHPGLTDAAVVARKRQGESVQLVACVVPTEEGLTMSELRSWLSERLPSYMVPSFFFPFSELPVTSNGKVDRRKLLGEAEERMEAEVGIECGREPVTEEERVLTAAVAAVLGLNYVSPDDNYFMLGGDSIKAIQLTWGLRERGYTLQVRDLFIYPILADAATCLRKEEETAEEERVEGEVALTPIQHWFFESFPTEERNRFNQSVLLRSEEGRIDPEKMERALGAIIEHHDILRARFEITDGVPRQIVQDEVSPAIELVDLSSTSDSSASFREELRRTHGSIEVTTSPLLKAKLIRREEGDFLHLVAHHLIVDVVSWHLLVADLLSAYTSLEGAEPIALPKKSASYRSWSKSLEEIAQSSGIEEADRFWRDVADQSRDAGIISVDDSLPNRNGDAESLTVALDVETTRRLLSDANNAYNTETRDLLLAALGEALCRQTASDSCLIALEGHGRSAEGSDLPDVSRTAGWFTALYPLLLRKGRDRGYGIKETKEGLRSLPMEGISYGICRYLASDAAGFPDLLTGRTQLVLNYLGSEGEDGTHRGFTLQAEPEGIGFAPEGNRPFEIEVIASVRDGAFRATFTWGGRRIGRERIEAIAKRWIEELEGTVAHTLEVESPELTPSDIDYDGLSIDDLDDILSQIGT